MITLSKLAKLANVSVSTASKAFSGSGEINSETREMIFDVAKKHGCFKKFYNIKYPKLVIAVIIPEFNSSYYAEYLYLIQKNLEKYNCELCVSVSDFSETNEKQLTEYYYKHSSVDAIIVINSMSEFEKSEECEIPIIYVNPVGENHNISISADLKPALKESVNYLLENNVTDIGFIGESLTDRKLELFKQVLSEFNICCKNSFTSVSNTRFEQGGYDAMENIFSTGDFPRAVICAYDNLAIGAIRCIHDHGLSVPQDIAILGMDDIPQANFLNPPLASISSCTEKICKIATENVINRIHKEKTQENIIIKSELKLRRSFEIFK